jgi:uncharacterized membrane-anchored protein
MAISLSTEQLWAAIAGVAGLGGWLFLQWRKAVEDYNSLHKNFYKLLRDEAKAMAEMVDAELRSLHARIGSIKQNMLALADQLAAHRQSASLSLPEFEQLTHELFSVETELNAVTSRAREVDRKKRETQLVLSELSADTFDREKYEAARKSFAAQTPAAAPIVLRLPSPSEQLRLGRPTATPQIQQKLRELEAHARRLQSVAGESLEQQFISGGSPP